MPRVYLTLEEKKKSDAEKEFRKQDRLLRGAINEKINCTYEELAQKAGVSKSTIQKFVNNPTGLRIDLLRKCCFAAEIPLIISVGK